MSGYTFMERPSVGLLRTVSEYGSNLWTRVKARKWATCEICHERIMPGHHSYRPLTNGYNRMHRFCAACAETPP